MSLKGTLRDIFNWVTDGIGAQAEDLAAKSDLWGLNNGPADALRHIARAAMMVMELGETKTRALLLTREVAGSGSTNSNMDFYNNEIGIKLAQYLKEHGGTREDAMRLAKQLVEAGVNGANLKDWKIIDGKGMIVHPDGRQIEVQLAGAGAGIKLDLPALAQYSPGEPVPFTSPDQMLQRQYLASI
jgi:hypothetical protein